MEVYHRRNNLLGVRKMYLWTFCLYGFNTNLKMNIGVSYLFKCEDDKINWNVKTIPCSVKYTIVFILSIGSRV